MKKANCLDYINDDNINKYGQLTVYPHRKFFPMGWERYGGDHPKTLCYKVIGMIGVPGGITKECYWFDKVAPIMNNKTIDTRSNNNRGAYKKNNI